MNKFVILCFAVMGWAFWEMSGGADFQPPERPVAERTAERTTPPAPKPRRDTPVLTRRNPTPAPAPDPERTQPADAPRITIEFGPRGLPPADPNNPGLLVSLEQSKTQFATPLASFDPSAEPEETTPAASVPQPSPAAPDLREIRGTRVNMRDGPGTIYPVVTRLRLGQAVEVLSDSGTGWLRVRVPHDRTLGWVAASLVTKDRR